MKAIFNILDFATLSILVIHNDAVLLKDVEWCASPYCVPKINHTICKWGLNCEPLRRCNTNLDFNKEMKDYIMELHNEKRNQIALGDEHKVPENVRKASDMNVMQWDIHLEFVARCHSRQCDPKHDDCRVVLRFSEVGQNMFTKTFNGDEAEAVEAKDIIDTAVKEWYNEVENVTDEVYNEWTKTEKQSDRFTQMIWAKTTHMGCGLSEMKRKDGSLKFFLVCNYGTEGNKKGKPIYTVGDPCSNCSKKKTCNSEYKGLCGKIKEYALKCPCEEEAETTP